MAQTHSLQCCRDSQCVCTVLSSTSTANVELALSGSFLLLLLLLHPILFSSFCNYTEEIIGLGLHGSQYSVNKVYYLKFYAAVGNGCCNNVANLNNRPYGEGRWFNFKIKLK